MKLRSLIALVLLAPLGYAPFDWELTQGLRIEPDQNNVTADRLVGKWESDPLVSERMGMKATTETVEFAPDESFLDEIPEELAANLKDIRLYESGVVTWARDGRVKSSGPYLLTTVSGNPHILMFRERDGDPLGDIESGNVFVAPGKERSKDLLLIGGDFDNEPFRSFRRVEDAK